MSITTADIRSLYANLVERMVCALLDLVLIVLLVVQAGRYLPAGPATSLTLLAVCLSYLSLAWSSSWRATPAQLLFRLRVVDTRGERLSFGRAVLRSALVIGTFIGCMAIVGAPRANLLAAVFLPCCGFLLLSAVTARRQAAHDYVAGSLVVRARALRDPRLRSLLEMSADDDLESRSWLRYFRLGDLIQAIILIGGGAFLIYSMAEVTFTREIRARTSYAISHAGLLKIPIQSFYVEHGRLPDHALELGAGERTSYPDGGFYELESGGVIRIRFEKLPELVDGSLTLTPVADGDDLEWTCETHGAIRPGNVPSICRG